MAQTKDYYAVLGVKSTATQDEIKKQYRRMAKQHHPDAHPNDPKAADRFKGISEAYTVLGDAAKRKQYDEMSRLGAFGGFADRARGSSRPDARRTSNDMGGASRPSTGGRGPQDASARFEEFDIGGLGGLGDLFGSMFGGGARTGAGRSRGPEQGQSVESTLEIPFKTAAIGGKVPIELEVTEECATCHGNGAAPGATFKVCPECAGRGTVSFGQGGFAVSRPCPMCLGRGQVPSERCPTCSGAGEVRSRKKVLITVPPGTESGSKIRLKGQGGKGTSGGPAGDLLITFQVQADAEYTREGLDVIAMRTINVAGATLGTKIDVQTLEGKKVTLKVPPGTASGKRFRIRGQGVQKGTGVARGDLIVEIAIDVPATLTEEQSRMMKGFAESVGLKY